MPDYNQTGAEPASRSAFTRAARSNHPLTPPASLHPRSAAARRWTDLCRFYGPRVGPERLAHEGTRAKLLSLIHLTLRLEAMRDATQPLPLHSELHAVQEVRTLLQELGLNDDARELREPLDTAGV